MTASRLAALNHGLIKARIAGGEARLTLGIVREWAGKDVPEISVFDGANPVIRVQLADVDYQSILTGFAPKTTRDAGRCCCAA